MQPGQIRTFCLALLLCSVQVFICKAQTAPGNRPVLVTRTGGTLSALGLTVSPDGRWFVTQENTGAVTIWSAEDGAELRTFQPFPAFSQPVIGGRIAVASDASSIAVLAGAELQIWDVNDARELRHFSLEKAAYDGPSQIVANPSQMVLAAMYLDGTARVVSLTDGHELFRTKLPATVDLRAASQVQFSPDGKLLAVVTGFGFELWDWAAGAKRVGLEAHAFHSPDLARAITVQEGKTQRNSTAEQQNYFWFTGVSFSPNGEQIALTARDELTLLDVATGAKKGFTKTPEALVPGCLFVDSDHILLPEYVAPALQVNVYQISRNTLQVATNLSIQDYRPIPHAGRGVLISSTIPVLVNSSTFETVKVMLADARPPSFLGFAPSVGGQLLWGTWFKPLTTWNLEAGEASVYPAKNKITVPTLSPNGKLLAELDPVMDVVDIVDLQRPGAEHSFPVYQATHSAQNSVSFSGDGSLLATSQETGTVAVYSARDGNVVASATGDHPSRVSIAPGGTEFAFADLEGITIDSVASPPRLLHHLPALVLPGSPKPMAPTDLEYSRDGKWLAVVDPGTIRVFSTATWELAHSITAGAGLCVAFSPDSTRIAATAQGLGIEVTDLASGKQIFSDPTHHSACPVAFNADGSVLAAGTDYGAELFSMATGDVLASLYLYGGEQGLDWLVATPDGLFDGSPAAWNQLSWRFSGKTFDLLPVEVFFREYYRPGLLAQIMAGEHPTIPTELAKIDRRQPRVTLQPSADASGPIAVRSILLNLTVTEAPADTAHRTGSGAQDLRLFRNGTLVRGWNGTIHLDANGRAQLSAEVPIVAGENRFTVYAFSRSNIKSPDAAVSMTGADTLRRRGVAWVIAMGIDHYAASTPADSLDLSFAEGDASDFASQFAKYQQALQQFGEVRRIDLLGANAMRANLRTALRVLSGSKQELSDSQQRLLAGVTAVQPEDGVFLFYAGHGAALNGHFYLIPEDYDPRFTLSDPRSHTVSDVDLSQMLEGISPARSFLIIDACNSGQAVDSRTVVGPTNSKGLAELAYEKGLTILAASKDTEPALEAQQLGGGHGFLTYALVEEGLKRGEAAADGVVELRPWFAYAVRRVPDLQTAQIERRALSVGGPDAPKQTRQHPRIFYRREPERDPFIVAKIGSATESSGAGSR